MMEPFVEKRREILDYSECFEAMQRENTVFISCKHHHTFLYSHIWGNFSQQLFGNVVILT